MFEESYKAYTEERDQEAWEQAYNRCKYDVLDGKNVGLPYEGQLPVISMLEVLKCLTTKQAELLLRLLSLHDTKTDEIEDVRNALLHDIAVEYANDNWGMFL